MLADEQGVGKTKQIIDSAQLLYLSQKINRVFGRLPIFSQVHLVRSPLGANFQVFLGSCFCLTFP